MGIALRSLPSPILLGTETLLWCLSAAVERSGESAVEKTKTYINTRFPAAVLKEVIEEFEQTVATAKSSERLFLNDQKLVAELADETWEHDDRQEFFSDYRRAISATVRLHQSFVRNAVKSTYRLFVDLSQHSSETRTKVSVATPTRREIENVFEVLEKYADECRIKEPETETESPVIFIGHGSGELWKQLKDHLHEKHGYVVEAFENEARSGHAIRDILGKMLNESNFAVIVMTCDDKIGGGSYRARQNVVHEAGLFQGHLGFSRVIVLVEDGVARFSNLEGIHQVRFSKGKIQETFGEVIAVVRREFAG